MVCDRKKGFIDIEEGPASSKLDVMMTSFIILTVDHFAICMNYAGLAPFSASTDRKVNL